jgi:hypothetical protein
VGTCDGAAVHVSAKQHNHTKHTAAIAAEEAAIKAVVNIGSEPSPVAHRCLQVSLPTTMRSDASVWFFASLAYHSGEEHRGRPHS